MARKLKNVKNETQKMFFMEYGEKLLKTWKMSDAHCRTWSMERKRKIMENKNTHCMTWNTRE
jgi:hypothetical protein